MYHSFELATSNRFSVLSNMSTMPSIDSSFSPTTFSSPQKRTLLLSLSSSSSQSSRQEAAQLPDKKPKQNLRILVSNCQSICNKRSQFVEAVDYLNPDVVIGTESWLSKDIKVQKFFHAVFKRMSTEKIEIETVGVYLLHAKTTLNQGHLKTVM